MTLTIPKRRGTLLHRGHTRRYQRQPGGLRRQETEQEPLLWFPREGIRESGQAGTGLASWDNFSRLGGKWLPLVLCSLALGWLVGQLVRAPQRRGCGCGLWTGLFAYERCRTGRFALLEWPALGGAVSLGSASPQDAKASERLGQYRAKQEPGRGVSWRLCLKGPGFQEER